MLQVSQVLEGRCEPNCSSVCDFSVATGFGEKMNEFAHIKYAEEDGKIPGCQREIERMTGVGLVEKLLDQEPFSHFLCKTYLNHR